MTTDIKQYFYIIPMRTDGFLYACIVEPCRRSTKPVFKPSSLHIYACALRLKHCLRCVNKRKSLGGRSRQSGR